jgi:hypothetical protein
VKPICRRRHAKRYRNEQQWKNQFRFHGDLQMLGAWCLARKVRLSASKARNGWCASKAVSFLRKILSA